MRSTPVWFRTDEGMAMTTMPDKTTRRVTIGVDTHRDIHMVCLLDERGAELGVQPFSADPAGYRKTLAWATSFGTIDAAGVEGTGTYGAGLTRFLHHHDIAVIEISGPNRQRRRSHGKSDPLDARAAARAAQSGEANAQPKTRTGNVEAIRALRIARRSAAHSRVDALNQMRALLVTGPDDLRAAFRDATVTRMVTTAARLRPTDPTTAPGATKYALRELARRAQTLQNEIERLDAILRPLIAATAPDLLARHGVGPDTAGALLVTVGDNPQRLRNQAAFAHLCGTAPIEASSGLTKRHRLNRGGNRTANEALWRIVIVRMNSDPKTRQYVQRRTTEGLSKKEIIRCLKRYVARELYPYLTTPQPTP
jgi:transposase